MTCVSMIVAMANNNIIGHQNQLPWHLPEDLKHFKVTTMGKPIIMGRKTFESIGKPLPGRDNIVVTRDRNYHAEGIIIAHDLETAIANCSAVSEAMIIGGGQLYRQGMELAQKLYITRIFHNFQGDTSFPDIDDDWQLISEDRHHAQAGFEYSFEVYQRLLM